MSYIYQIKKLLTTVPPFYLPAVIPWSWTSLGVVTGHLAASLWGHTEFLPRYHTQILKDKKSDILRHRGREAEEAFGVESGELTGFESQCLRRGHNTGRWITLEPITVNRMYLGSQEWCNIVFICYGIDPPDLPHNYDVFGVGFSVTHALNCNKGGLVTAQHNELCNGVADLACKALTSTHVRYNPLITPGRAIGIFKTINDNTAVPNKQPGKVVKSKQKEDLLTTDLWEKGFYCVLYIQVVNMDAKS